MATPRITNTQLASRLDSFEKAEEERHKLLQGSIDKQGGDIKAILDAMQLGQIDIAIAKTEREVMQKQLEKEIERLDKRVNGWSITNSIGALIALILGYLGINR